jgi:protein-disulfide isomerase/uncharacterized membrane protein YphA (DoxX/SURF4 family)
VGLGLRLLLGGLWVFAGVQKIADPAASLRAVRGYQLLPESLVVVVGYGLPFLEVALGVLLVVGFGTRVMAAASVLLLIVFIVAIGSAWARGLRIECGCFGGGGLSDDPTRGYVTDILRDLGLGAASAFLLLGPSTRLSVDAALASRPPANGNRGGRAGRVGFRAGLAGVVGLVLVAAASGFGAAAQVARLGSSDPAAGIQQGTVGRYGIPHGEPSVGAKVEIVEDFQCPSCRALYEQAGEALDAWAEDGTAFVVYRPVAFLDRASTTDYSSRALAAAGCVEDLGGPAAFMEMQGLLFEQQPPEGSAGLSDEALTDLATETGVSNSVARGCIDDGQFASWVSAATEQASKDGVSAIPTVMVNGQPVVFTGEEDPVETLRRAIESVGGLNGDGR